MTKVLRLQNANSQHSVVEALIEVDGVKVVTWYTSWRKKASATQAKSLGAAAKYSIHKFVWLIQMATKTLPTEFDQQINEYLYSSK